MGQGEKVNALQGEGGQDTLHVSAMAFSCLRCFSASIS